MRESIMEFFLRYGNGIGVFIFALCCAPHFVWAQAAEPHAADGASAAVRPVNFEPNSGREEKRRKLAQDFLSRMKNGMQAADRFMQESRIQTGDENNLLPDGEILLFQPVLPDNFRVDGVVMAQVLNQKVLVSLKDFAQVLNLPIKLDMQRKVAEGWYIREDKKFFIDIAGGSVKTDQGGFSLSPDILVEEDDLFVPVHDLGRWLDFRIKTVTSSQEMEIKPSQLLPIQERFYRRKREFMSSKIPEPSLPRGGEDYQKYGAPAIDVATNSSYQRKGGESEGERRHTANIRTAGDFAHGTLTTQTQANDDDQITSVRLNYERESDKPDLLGKLKARRYEVGDVTTTRVPLGGVISQEFGGRITNADPLRGDINPTTAISGEAFPDWDVELYRDEQLVGFQEVGDDGRYQFDNVTLFSSDNNFRLVFYGPQGEIEEETLYVPVDNRRLANSGGVYDVSLTMEDKQSYRKDLGFADEDEGTPNLAALYERSLGGGVVGSVGFRSSEEAGTRNNVANVALSGTALQTLVNAGAAVDDEGEGAAELALRRNFGKHEFSNILNWTGENFDVQTGGTAEHAGVIKDTLSVIGPIGFPLGTNPRYNATGTYTADTEGNESVSASGGVTTAWKQFTLGQQVDYEKNADLPEEISTQTNLGGQFGRNRVRLLADYSIKPESELDRVLASYRRVVNRKLDFTLEAERRIQQELTEYSAKLDWQAGFARISPRITYDSEHDFFAGLSTRFGILKDPQSGDWKSYDRNVTNTGGVSAFVFLDKDGNGAFNEGDEPLEGIKLKAPQNGGQQLTDEKGIAIFSRMRETKLTDVYIDPETLQDPSWVVGFEGVSVLPRPGYIASVDFPVHLSGEMDGTLYMHAGAGEAQPLRDIGLTLYNDRGEAQQKTKTDPGGFYYFSQIPPGRYLLIIDEEGAQAGNFIRPEPEAIEIGYAGTVMYGRDIHVQSGGGDVPSAILANMDDYKKLHPHVDFSGAYETVLNLGEYNSQLLMSVVLYKLRTRYGAMLEGGDLFVPPTQSYASVKTGKHTLRVGLKDAGISDAYKRCRALMAREQYCKVEIYPAYIKQARAEDISSEPVMAVK